MNKSDFKLYVMDVKTSAHEYVKNAADEDTTLVIEAWDGKRQIDEHITEEYPELEDLGLYDCVEGSMYYTPEGVPFTAEEMATKLERMGFEVVVGDCPGIGQG